MSPEVLLESGVGELQLERSSVRKPITEKQSATVHPVIAGKFEIEDTHSGFCFGKGGYKGTPIFFLISGCFNDLDSIKVTTFSFSTL